MVTKEAATSSPGSSEKTEAQARVSHPQGGLHLPSVPSVPLGMPTGTAGRVLWWGGLATVAAVGIVDWPVAALIGLGSWVAEQYAKAARQQDGEPKAS